MRGSTRCFLARQLGCSDRPHFSRVVQHVPGLQTSALLAALTAVT
jgi:hypothetical protein